MADLTAAVTAELGGPGTAAVDVTGRLRDASGYSGREPGHIDQYPGYAQVRIDDDDVFLRPSAPTLTTHDPANSPGGGVVVDVSVLGRAFRMWTGRIDRVTEKPRKKTSDSVLECSDPLARLANLRLSGDAAEAPRRAEFTGTRFGAVMDAAGFDPGDYSFDRGYGECAPLPGGLGSAVGADGEPDTVARMVARCVNSEVGVLRVDNGRSGRGRIVFGGYVDPHRLEPPDLVLTDQPRPDTADILLEAEPTVLAYDPALLVNAVNNVLADGTVVRSEWPGQIAAHNERPRDNPVWLAAADAKRNGYRWLGVYGRLLLVPSGVVIRPDALPDDAAAAALGAKIGDRVTMQWQQEAGGVTTPLDRQFILTGIGWSLWPLEPPFCQVELSWNLLPAEERTRWVLGRSRLGPVGTGADRSIPWAGTSLDPAEPVRPRNWEAAGERANVYAEDFDRLLRRRVIARYGTFAGMVAGEEAPLPNQLAVVTATGGNDVYAYNRDAAEWSLVASTR